jgi:hypothetical protein
MVTSYSLACDLAVWDERAAVLRRGCGRRKARFHP